MEANSLADTNKVFTTILHCSKRSYNTHHWLFCFSELNHYFKRICLLSWNFKLNTLNFEICLIETQSFYTFFVLWNLAHIWEWQIKKLDTALSSWGRYWHNIQAWYSSEFSLWLIIWREKTYQNQRTHYSYTFRSPLKIPSLPFVV